MPPGRKRRSQRDPSEADSPPQPAPSRRRLTQATQLDSDDADSDSRSHSDSGSPPPLTQSTQNVAVKKLVRLALASEYSRQPIRRNDITQKVLGEGSRQFKPVFEEAQKVLRERFGMHMVELPVKEKLTISQRRAAQRAERPALTSKSWVLTSTLPSRYRSPTILPPSRAPSAAAESAHIALYTFIISLVMLSGGSMQESRLERCLRRVNAEAWTPVDRTDRFLQRLCREGYLVRHRDVDGGEEVVEYHVGPRGRVEVGVSGVGGMVREVYGFGRSGEDDVNEEGKEDFEKRLNRSLGVREVVRDREENNGEGSSSRRGRRTAYEDGDEDEDEDDD